MSNANTKTINATNRPKVSIEECLFGPSKVCPPDVWEAVMGGGDVTSRDQLDSTRKMKIDDLLDGGGWSTSQKHTIQLQELRRLASQGMDHDYKAVAWRVLLGVLPLDTSAWKDVLTEKRNHYRSLVSDVFMDPQLSDGNELRGNHGKRRSAQASREYHLKHCASFSPVKKDGTLSESKDTEDKNTDGEDIQNENVYDNSQQKQENNVRETQPSSTPEDNQKSGEKEEKHSLSTNDVGEKLEVSDNSCNNKDTPIMSNVYSDDSKSQGSLANIVPERIQEEWKKSGRDIKDLDCMSGSSELEKGMNMLLLTEKNFSTKGTKLSDGEKIKNEDGDSKWFQFFENASLLDEIRKDVVRTHPDLYFFLEPENNLGKRRYAALERVLFVWAGLNKGVRYVQGMNEIVGTIYYVLANDENDEWACEAEADTYFLFNTLMAEMRDIFVPDLDEADTGIQGRISNMTALLSLHDPEVRCHLVDIGIDPAYYAIRWLTTLLSREFLLPDTIRLWDSMFASTHKDNFMRYVCVTMIMIIRRELLKGDFSTCLRLLQAYPTTNIDGLLEASRSLWIYESQVTLACHKGGISLQQALCTITPPPSIVMAYGLPGGVARTKLPNAESSSPSNAARGVNGNSRNNSGGGGFFSRANAIFGRNRSGFR